MFGLTDENYKATITNTFKELKEVMFRELKEGMTTVT